MKDLRTRILNGEIKTLVTHGGTFHADDVFSTALIMMANGINNDARDIEIKRVFKVPEELVNDPSVVIYDIGGGQYDHHQPDAEVRNNGIKYAAFGLLWRELGSLFVREERVAQFDEEFVQILDNTDNTGERNMLSNIVSSLNPLWDKGDCETTEQQFGIAWVRAVNILEREFERINSKDRASSIVSDALVASNEGDIVVLPQFAPGWQEKLVPSKAKFIVFPSLRGGYNAQVVPKELGLQDAKIPFPSSWAGLRDADIQEVSGIDGLTFCHAGRFLCAADTVESAIKACEKAIELAE